MMGLRLPELLIILLVLVLVFGANKIPQLGDALGKGIRNFKKSAAKGEEEDSIDVTPKDEASQGHLTQGTATATPPSRSAAEKKA